MTYSSLIFIYGFFPLSLALYFITPKKFRDIILFLLSMIFCLFFSFKFLVFMLSYTVFNYIAARMTYNLRWKEPKYKSLSLIPFSFGIIFDILVVFIFRTEIFSVIYENIKLPEGFFPVSVSFFTFSAIGYLVDVYKGRIRAEINFIRFGLFIMMFSRIFCPVGSYDNFIIHRKKKVRMNEIGEGVALFVKGLVKKVIVADSLFMLYSDIKGIDIKNLSCLNAWIGIIVYVLCLYFTLSGVSDMGAGISGCFGFKFPQSFNYPLFESRIRYFYAKWHIPVTHWIRRYIVKPVCSSVINDKYIGFFIPLFTFIIMGFWYTFNLKGVIWGFFMGISIIIEDKLKNIKMLKSTGIIYTFLVITVLSVFLSCGNFRESLDYLFAMIGGNRLFADSVSAYLLRSYIIIILVAMYASTDLFKNTVARIQKTRLKIFVSLFSPVAVLLAFIICTALISYTGSSDMILMNF